MQLIARRRGDAGYTLVELLLVMVILGVISVPLGNLVISYFRNTSETTIKLNESHDAQITNAYWQKDVASIGLRSATYDAANATFPLQQSVNIGFPCALPAGVSVPFVVLAWSQYDSVGAATSVAVGYAMKGARTLVRLRCTGATLDSATTLAKNLTAPPSVTCAGAGGASCTGSGASVPETIALGLAIRDPDRTGPDYTATLTGQRRQTT